MNKASAIRLGNNIKEGIGGNALRYGGGAAWSLIEYGAARREGHGMLYSTGRAAVVTGLYTIAPTWAILGYMGYSLGGPMAKAGLLWGQGRRSAISRIGRPFSPDFRDNPTAMRERQLLANELNASAGNRRGVRGREAQMMAKRYG